MGYNRICISSGHGLYVRGASGIIDEVDEARDVVERLTKELKNRGVAVEKYHDDVSHSQNENLNRIVDWHNAQEPHDLDISVHFNAYEQVSKPMGTEVLYVTQQALASKLSAAIASCGFIDRGGKYRNDLFVLNNTIAPAVLLEICFVDSEADCNVYDDQFDLICEAIANVLGGEDEEVDPAPPDSEVLFHAEGKCSYFGGPEDTGVSESEGLAFHYEINEGNQHLFLPIDNGTGLARRLNGSVPYLACRWDYDKTPKEMLANSGWRALVRANNGREALAFPADWGPHEATDRVADLSPGLMEILDIETDDQVEIVYPFRD